MSGDIGKENGASGMDTERVQVHLEKDLYWELKKLSADVLQEKNLNPILRLLLDEYRKGTGVGDDSTVQEGNAASAKEA